MPTVSVIIPVYNVEQYLHECLDSVVNQTMRDIEIVCVDDGSTDSSGVILDEYAEKDCRFVVIHQPNGGLSAARNTGLNACRGEYLLFLDSDDWIDTSTCEKAFSSATKLSADMVMFFYASVYDKQSKEIEKTYLKAECSTNDPIEKLKWLFTQGPSSCKWLWKRDFIESNHLRFYNRMIFEDVPFTVNAILRAKQITVLPDTLYYYRKRQNSICNIKNRNYCDYACQTYGQAFQDIKELNPSIEIFKILYKQKLNLIWNGYVNHTPQNLLYQFRKNIKNSIFPHEYEWIKNNELNLSVPQRLFFLSIYGNFPTRIIAKMKIAKYKIADSIVRLMIPHSPLLQDLIQQTQQSIL